MKDSDIVGEALASVLPQYDRIWLKVPHLLQLNLILLVPLLSSAVAGYDGKCEYSWPSGHLFSSLLLLEDAATEADDEIQDL